MGRIKKILGNYENMTLMFISFFTIINSLLFIYVIRKGSGLIRFWGIGKINAGYLLIFLLILFALVYMLRRPISFSYLAKRFFLVFLPTEIILLSVFLYDAYYYHGNTAYFLDSLYLTHPTRFLSSLYLILLGFFGIFRYKKYSTISQFIQEFRSDKSKSEEKQSKFFSICQKIPIISWFSKQGKLASSILIIVVALNFGFGFYHLADFAAVDEPLWTYGRIPKFWSNIQDGEIYKTMISDKPGITVAILSGAGLHWVNPAYYKDVGMDGENIENYLDIRDLNIAMRLPLLIFSSLMLFLLYIFIKKLLGKPTALFSIILIGLSPLLLGIATIVNPDGILWIFTTLAMLSYFIFMKEKGNKYLYLSGVFLGLALLTKYVANILYVYFFGLIFLEYIFRAASNKELRASEYFKKSFSDFFILIFFSLLTFFIFLPAAWVKISYIFSGTIFSEAFVSTWPVFVGLIAFVFLDMFFCKNRLIASFLGFFSRFKNQIVRFFPVIFLIFILVTIINTWLGMKMYDFESILASPKSSHSTFNLSGLFLADFYSLIFGIAPMALISVLFLNIFRIIKKQIDDKAIWFFYIILFIILYYLASTVNMVSATVRYQIIIYPFIFILAAMGISELIKISGAKKYYVLPASYIILLLACAYSLNFIRPFYFCYASDLLPKRYVLNIKDMGDGSYEAAQYLNSLPNAKNLVVWTDKRGVCAFFVGQCTSGFDIDPKVGEKISYFIVSSGRETRTKNMSGPKSTFRLDKLYTQENYDWKLEIGGRPDNFVKIISVDKITN
jgi:hypothetical protein